jgi:hypothetical protein
MSIPFNSGGPVENTRKASHSSPWPCHRLIAGFPEGIEAVGAAAVPLVVAVEVEQP